MKFKKTDPAQAEINMTPMIDIVFQLIAFFMVIINFEQTQADERVKLPRDELARPPKQARKEKQVINIGYERTKEGKIIEGAKGGPFVWLPGAERTDVEKSDPLWPNTYKWPEHQKAFNQDLERIKRSKERDETLKETTIIIRSDGDTPGGIVTDIINACQLQGFEKFAFSATQKGGQDDEKSE